MTARGAVRPARELVDDETLAKLRRALAPALYVQDPVLLGLENVPDDRPLLFVGNHTLYGLFDVWAMVLELHHHKGIVLRGLGDHLHFQVPVWGELLGRLGAVDGTRDNCARLFELGETVLVFPGGAGEVSKRKHEQHQLKWKERVGFVRLAVAHGVTIVPFSAVGMDDAVDIVLDADDVFRSPLGVVLGALGMRRDVIMPIGRGLLGTPIPRPNRLYFEFAPPIRTAHLQGRADDRTLHALRDETRAAIEGGIARLLAHRAADPTATLEGRVRAETTRVLGRARTLVSSLAPRRTRSRRGTDGT